jgi:cell division protein FtsB
MKPARARFGYFVGMADKVGAEERPGQGNDQPAPPAAGKGEAASGSEQKPTPGEEQKPTDPKPPQAGPTAVMPAAPAEAEVPLQSRVDGLRGWLAALDRRVSTRTQVGIVLLALAIGFGAAALYVAIDARENGASEARVESLREALQALNVRTARTAAQVRELQARQGAQSTGGGAALQSLQAQVTQLNAQVEALQGGSTGAGNGGVSGTQGGGSSGGSATPGAESESPSGTDKGTTTP